MVAANGPDIAKLKAQVMTGNVEWDVIDLIGSQVIAADRTGVLEKLDYSVIDASDMAVQTSPRACRSTFTGVVSVMIRRAIPTANSLRTGSSSGTSRNSRGGAGCVRDRTRISRWR